MHQRARAASSRRPRASRSHRAPTIEAVTQAPRCRLRHLALRDRLEHAAAWGAQGVLDNSNHAARARRRDAGCRRHGSTPRPRPPARRSTPSCTNAKHNPHGRSGTSPALSQDDVSSTLRPHGTNTAVAFRAADYRTFARRPPPDVEKPSCHTPVARSKAGLNAMTLGGKHKPDLVWHVPGDSRHNAVVVEVKAAYRWSRRG